MRTLFTGKGSAASANPAALLVKPRIQIEIFGANGHFGPGQQYDPTLSFIAVSTNDTMSQASGQAVLTLAAGILGSAAPPTYTWLDLIMQQDLVIVRMAADTSPTSPLYTVFVGYAQTPQITEDPSNTQQIQRYFQVVLQDLAYGLTAANFSVPATTLAVPTDEYNNPLVRSWTNLFLNLQAAVTATVAAVNPAPVQWIALWLNSINPGNTQAGTTNAQMTPSQIIQQLIRILVPVLFSPTTQLDLPFAAGAYGYTDLLRLMLVDTSDFAWAAYNVGPNDGTMWQTLQSLTNAPFYEFFGALRSGGEGGAPDQGGDLLLPSPNVVAQQGPATALTTGQNINASAGNQNPPVFGPDGAQYFLCLRGAPFSAGIWETLGTQTVPAGEIVNHTLGRSLQDIANLYLCYPEALNQSASNAVITKTYPAIVDPDSVLTYGLSPLNIPLYGLLNPTSNNQFEPNLLSVWNQVLYQWYWYNPYFLSGTITVRGNPGIRKGQRLYVPEWGMEAYIEGVAHTYTWGSQFTTALSISRGAPTGAQYSPANFTILPLATPATTGGS